MNLEKLRLHHYRNYEDLDITFDDGMQILVGKNAQGKTNVLEAILYLSTTRSHRSNHDDDLIMEGMEAFLIAASIKKKHKRVDLRLTVNERGKNLFIYHNPIVKVSDFIGEFNSVMFCPDDMNLFHASPRVRRRFVDMELSKLSKTYINKLYIAQKLLKERNMYLKRLDVDKTYLDVLTTQMIDAQVIIMKQRFSFLKQLIQKCEKFYKELSNDHTSIQIEYESCVPYHEDSEVLKEILKKKYDKTIDRDIVLKQTTIGIHKEDFIFQMNGKNIDTYASQGQKRSVLLAIKVGMIYMIHEITNDYPVLLLDDVFSELDAERKKILLKTLPEEVQIFISTNDNLDVSELKKIRNVTSWSVHDGKIKRC